MLNFDSFMVCLNNLHPSINYTYEKAKVTRKKKGNLVQILNFSDVNVIPNIKIEISTDAYYNDTIKYIIVFVTDPEKDKLRLNELTIWLINNKYHDHIISNAFFNAKILLFQC